MHLRAIIATSVIIVITILSYKNILADVRADIPLPENFIADKDKSILQYPDLGTVSVQPVRFEAPAGEGFMAVSFHCGLLFEQADSLSQLLTTIGTGETELLSCDGLVDLAIIDTNDDANHIGLIYDLRTPNTLFRAAMIVSWQESSGTWIVNESLSNEATIPPGTDTLIKLQQAFANR